MNTDDHSARVLPPQPARRRRRPGSATWPSPASRPWAAREGRGPARPEAAALPGPGQARHLPLHGGRAVARRHLRLQAEADRRRRQADRQGPGRRRPSCSARPGSSSSTARAASGSPSCSPRSPSTPTTSASSTACRPTCRTTRRRSCRCTPASSSSPGRRWGRGRSTASGTENENLPGFVTHLPAGQQRRRRRTTAARSCRPSTRARRIGIGGRPVADATVAQHHQPRSSPRRPAARSSTSSRRSTARRWSATRSNPAVEGVIESYELAFRMQGELPKVMDLSSEIDGDAGGCTASATTATDDFGRQCLLARRFVEAGVRFVEVCHGGWDQHRDLKADARPATPPPSTSRSPACWRT